jgi:Zn finger protein HypA/HybF involved in hydrogenase expression
VKCECTRCRNKHDESERKQVRSKEHPDVEMYDLVCPKCRGRNFYKLDENGKRAKA